MIGKLIKNTDGWVILYTIVGDSYGATVEIKLQEEDYKYAKEDAIVQFEVFNVGNKTLAKLVETSMHQRVVNEHLKQIIL
jgi:hypothetical protein